MKKVGVIGAGLVGLATAYEYKKRSPDSAIFILEKESKVGFHQSGRNSGVIHSGIYYKPGSLKALNCLKGRTLLENFCDEFSIAYDKCGKVVVATNSEQIASLDKLYQRALDHGLKAKMLTPEVCREIEPHVHALKAIQIPETGIVDYPGMAKKLQALIEADGGKVHLNTKIVRISEKTNEVALETTQGDFTFDYVVNCAGLHSDVVARASGAQIDSQIVPFRGEYYELKKDREHLCRHLIYPVPDLRFPFLGVHLTRMIHGGVECGPNAVFALAREGYTWKHINLGELLSTLSFRGFWSFARTHWKAGLEEVVRSLSKGAFARSLAKLIPEITVDDLVPGGAGVRAQAMSSTGALVDDFLFHQTKKMLHVLNAPSPAATSCLSLGCSIVEKMGLP